MLSDQALLDKLKSLVTQERALLSELLRYLREVETRKLHVARGYSSLFSFCTGELGYSESEAHARIQAMRLIKAVPQAEKYLESGALSLSVAAGAQGCFRREEKAARPLAEVQKIKIVNELLDSSAREAEKKLAAHFPEEKIPKEKTKPINEELTRIEFNADRKLCEKLERLKGLLAHKNYSGRMDLLIEELADLALRKLDPQKDDAPILGTSQVKSSRFIRAAVKRAVWKRDMGRCQFQDSLTGKKCESKHGLQFDHIVEFSKGGGNDPANLRLLCGAHNRWRSACH